MDELDQILLDQLKSLKRRVDLVSKKTLTVAGISIQLPDDFDELDMVRDQILLKIQFFENMLKSD